MSQIFLIRHGQASFGADDYDNLSELGERQSRRCGAEWGHIGAVDFVISGNMRRHLQTAEAFAEAYAHDLPAPTHDPGWNEYDHEEIFARAHPELADRAALMERLHREEHPRRMLQDLFAEAVDRWVGGDADAEYTESFAVFAARVTGALGALTGELPSGSTALVFTSGGPITAVVQHLLAIPNERVFSLNWSLVNTGVTRLLTSDERTSVSFTNNYAHMHGEDALITFR